MALVAPEDGFHFAKVPLTGVLRAVVIGEVHSFWSHWYRIHGTKRVVAVRCLRDIEDGCFWCEREFRRSVRYLLPVRIDGQPRVLEFGRVQYPALATIEAFGGLVGVELECGRESAYRNSPIQVRSVGRERVPPEAVVDLTAFVASVALRDSKHYREVELERDLLSGERVRDSARR